MESDLFGAKKLRDNPFRTVTYSFKLTVFADEVILSLCYCFGNSLDNTRVEKKIVFVAIILLNKNKNKL